MSNNRSKKRQQRSASSSSSSSSRTTGRQQRPTSSKARQAVADLAARYMLEQGLRDYQLAKQKACATLGISENPSNAEISAQLTARQRVFSAEDLTNNLAEARQTAQQVANFLSTFKPHLADNLLTESFADNEAITLHCQAEHLDLITIQLHDSGIEYELHDKAYRLRHGDPITLPVLHCTANQYDIRIVVFTPKQWPNKPISPRDGLPMQRAKLV